MESQRINSVEYNLPKYLNEFQQEMYVHLISWKRNNLPNEKGENTVFNDLPILYPPIHSTFLVHRKNFPFREHKYFNHMASSQAANINLFLPLLTHPRVDEILRLIKPDFKNLVKNTFLKDKFDDGFRIEFWDEPYNSLNDKTNVSGTDSDIAIAYYNNQNEPCLWLVEHKLTEGEFTTCGGYKSDGRTDKMKHDCNQSFSSILGNKNYCYYHDKCHYKYWDYTEKHSAFFGNHQTHSSCPFKGGMNQLWRNQLLGLSIEDDERQPYKHVYFSVVRHPENCHLENTINAYKHLIGNNPKFSTFTSKDVIDKAIILNDSELNKWINWYRDLYRVS